MKHLRFQFDFISPYALLAFERLPQALEGLSYEVSYEPVLLAGLLQHWGSKGPAEIEPKKVWTFRQVAWIAHRQGVRLEPPSQHPFNSLALLRLALACAPAGGTPSRRVVERLFHHVWHGGGDAAEPARLHALVDAVQPRRDPQGDDVKQALRDATAAAAASGVFGVPTISVDDKQFWGLDSLDMVAACVRGDAWFDTPAWEAAARMPPGLRRNNA